MKIPKFKNGNGYYNLITEEELQNKTHVINFSGGRTSAYLLYNLLLSIPREKIMVNFANTGREDEATLEFVRDCEKDTGLKFNWLEYDLNYDNLDKKGKPKKWFKLVNFETASRNGEPLKKSIDRMNFVPNLMVRSCTIECKIKTMEIFREFSNVKKDDCIVYIGIRHDEPKRWSKNVNQFPNNFDNIAYPLVDWKVNKQMVLDFWKNSQFDLKLVEPFGNCDLCYLKSVKKRIAVLKDRPHVAEYWSSIETEKGQQFDRAYSVKQLLKIATGQTIADLSKERNFDIECNCNVD
jgi:3'-phosphoadenosine 5'-phosphosulfate sulfotransferase (PAPS reductase)/FAD synthetase